MSPSLAQVDAYEVPEILVERVAFLHQVPYDYAATLLREAKRMLYLSQITNTAVAPSGRVDWAWHEMLMFTRFYRDFSNYIGAFIHHDPNPVDKNDVEETWESINKTLGQPRRGTDTYNRTKSLYQERFGQAPDPLYWP